MAERNSTGDSQLAVLKRLSKHEELYQDILGSINLALGVFVRCQQLIYRIPISHMHDLNLYRLLFA